MAGFKKNLVAFLSAVLMMSSFGMAPTFAMDADLGNDDYKVVVDKKLNPTDLTVDLKIKLEDKKKDTPKEISHLSKNSKKEGVEKEELSLRNDSEDEYEIKISENDDYEFELTYSKEVKEAQDDAGAINREETLTFSVNVDEITEVEPETNSEAPLTQTEDVKAPEVSVDALGDADITLEVVDYDPSVEWKAGEQHQINVKVDFKDNNSTGKEIRINVPEGMEVVSYPVKGSPESGTPEYSMNGTLVDGVITESQKLEPTYYESYNGQIVYKVSDTTQIVELERMITVKVDEKIYYGPKTFTDAIKVEAFKNGDLADMKSFSHTTVEKVSYLLRAPSSNFHATVSKGDTDTLIMGNPRVSRDGRFNQTRFAVKNITTTMYYPIGTTIDDTQLTQTVVSKDDSIGKIVLSADNLSSSTSQLFTVPLKYGHLAEGFYYASDQSYFEINTYDGAVIKVTDKDVPKASLNIIDPETVPNKLTLRTDKTPFVNQHEDFSNSLVRYSILNDNTTVKTNQIIQLDFDANLEVKAALAPGGVKNVKKVFYVTNKNTSLREANKSQIVGLNSAGMTGVSQTILGLQADEYFTRVVFEMNDIPKAYRSADYLSNSKYGNIIGRLKDGAASGNVTVKVFARLADGTEDLESVVSETQVVSRIAKPHVRMLPNNDGKVVNAGDTTTLQFNLSEQYYYDNGANSFGIIDPEFFFIIPENTQIDMSTFKVWTSNKAIGSSDYTSEIYTINATGQRALRVQFSGVFGANYKDSYLPVLPYVRFNLNTNIKSGGIYELNKAGFWKLDKNWTVSNVSGQPGSVADTDDINNDNDVTERIMPAKATQLNIIPREELIIDTYIQPKGDIRRPSFDITKPETAVSFTPGTEATYTVDLLNNKNVPINGFAVYIPVPKEGNDFGKNFQSTPFAWNMKLNAVPKIEIYDKNGADISIEKGSSYKLTYSTDATTEANYLGAAYGTSFNPNTTMIRLENTSGSVESGERAVLVMDYVVDETPATAIGKLGKINDFMPFYSFDAGTVGWSSGSRVGANLEIGEIKGLVFLDANKNGIMDGSEVGLGSKPVELLKKDTNGAYVSVKTMNTNADGTYAFGDLGNGDYQVNFNGVLGSNQMFTLKGQGNDGMKDSDVDVKGPNAGRVSSIDPTSTQSGQITVGVIDYDLTQLTVKFDKSSETVKAKKEIDLATTITPDFFNSIKESMTFTSSKESVAIVSSTGRVTGQAVGTADITVTVTDIYGNTASDTIQVTVTSNTPPVLTLQKLVADVEINTSVNLSDYIASVTDNEDGPIDPSNVVITPSTLDTSVLGAIQNVEYSVKDRDDNEVKQTIKFTTVDTLAPTIGSETLNAVNINNSKPLTEAEFLALIQYRVTDNSLGTVTTTSDFDIKLTQAIQSKPGSVVVTLKATDASNNTQVFPVSVTLVDDVKPEITAESSLVLNSSDADLNESAFLGLVNVNATDNSGNVTVSSDFDTIVVDQKTPNAIGVNVTITATDGAGNTKSVTVKVTVKDTTAPILTIAKNVVVLEKTDGLTYADLKQEINPSFTDNGDMTGIEETTIDFGSVKGNEIGRYQFQIQVIDKAGLGSNVETITVNVVDKFDPNTNESMNAHDFSMKLDDAKTADLTQLKLAAEAVAFSYATNPEKSVAITGYALAYEGITVTNINQIGDYTVTFTTDAGTSYDVVAHIFDEIDPNTQEAINAHDFDIQLEDVNDKNLIEHAQAKAFTVLGGKPKEIEITKVTHAITGTGDYTVKFETDQGTSKEVTAHVYSSVNIENKEAMNADDFVIQLSYVNEINVKQLSGLEAYDISVNPALPLDLDTITVSDLPTTIGDHNITFTTLKGTQITVVAHVFDVIDNVNKIAMNAHDFSMLLDDVSTEALIANSGVEAFDVSNPTQITPITDITVLTDLPQSLGNHTVTFEATSDLGKTSTLSVVATLYNNGTVVPGTGSIYANNFEIKMKHMTQDSVRIAAGVTAFDAAGNAVDVQDIKLVGELPQTAGYHNFVFEAKGVQVTVLGRVSARYEVVGHDLNMTMTEFKTFKANGTLEKEIINRAEGKLINLDTGEEAELAEVDYRSIDVEKLAPGNYDIELTYAIDGDFIDEETSVKDPMTFGLMKTMSKNVNLNITVDSSNGNGSNNGSNQGSSNGSENGTHSESKGSSLPSTGIAVESTPVLLASGLVVLGFVLMLMNKKKKNENQ
ncbi:hypothetical protein EPJ90_07510 [Erysipelothrix sp. strain 2 (EsS2-7-Brazil)]|uniref:SdrD B-like domain-containing protein n=1 Tax=Erysipelothrix sp. strain 2 (EsS2-7-Brazil) TaxID=2500579 RepID=UPI00190C832E|nr:SdrD B-like domain-containing protein [Erysipelothrix sp. strain 2 (EsS2-7-Brazil)]MBK2404675.1 hypothetical protein [Erysipelothrix sp. strain 2 (EsS2-7-Brazil)]